MASRSLGVADPGGGRSNWSAIVTAPVFWVAALTLLALAARLWRLGEPVLRWDEGWSLGHASLPWSQLWQVAAADRHPPAYLALLKLWLIGGKSAWSLRFLSVFLGTLAVPVAYRAAREWSASVRVGVLAAGFAACWPLLVYYGQVTRMYALSALAVLAAGWLILRGESHTSWWLDLGLVVSATVALYTLYATAWALAGLWAYAAIAQPRRIPRLLVLGLAVLGSYLPWLLAAQATLHERIAGSQVASGSPILNIIGLLKPTAEGLAFVYGSRPQAAAVLGVVLAAGVLVGRWSRSEAKKMLLPLLVVGASALGVAYSARAGWFSVRHLVPASAFLGLLVAWALARLAWRWWPLLPVALLALAVVYWPTCTGFVYEKMLEVTEPFDPSEDHRYLAQHAGPNDLVYFNVLARAGWYENLRQPQDPAWSYAMRWDPVIEPMDRIAARISLDILTRHRLWFALYKGDYGPNAPLVEWLDANLFPAGGEWQGDVLYQAYVAPVDRWASTGRDDRFEQGIRLKAAQWTPHLQAGGACAVALTWKAERPVSRSYKVFVHALDDSGQLVAQHDGIPGTGRRPTSSWQAGVEVPDRHGLLLPPASAGATRLHIRVGLYDPETGERLRLQDGSDAVELCTIEVEQAALQRRSFAATRGWPSGGLAGAPPSPPGAWH